jgi:hypothetical protein
VIPSVCTSGLTDDRQALARAIADGGTAPVLSSAPLDEADWLRLRRACPARPGDRRVDLAAAERLLADPLLYRRALGGDQRPGAASLTQSSAATLTDPLSPLISAPSMP